MIDPETFSRKTSKILTNEKFIQIVDDDNKIYALVETQQKNIVRIYNQDFSHYDLKIKNDVQCIGTFKISE
jgi:hypothetical protein